MIRFLIIFLVLTSVALAGKRETYYCIQISSNHKLSHKLKETYRELLKSYPYVRIEKISNYFTLRVGFWKKKRTAKVFYRKLRKEYKNSFLRTCYLIPSRWVLPHKSNLRESSVKLKKISTKSEEKKVSVREILKKTSKLYIPSPIKFTRFNFPETRIKKERRNINFFLKGNFSFGNLNFQKVNLFLESGNFKDLGITIMNYRESHIYPYINNFLIEKKRNFHTFYVGVCRRISPFEDLSSPGFGLSYNPFPLSFEMFAGNNFFRNGANDVSLEGLKFASLNLRYKMFPDLILTANSLYESKRSFKDFKLNRRFWGNISLFFKKFYISTASSEKGGYLATVGFKGDSIESGLSVDRNLPYPLTSKGRVLSESNYDFFLNLDPLNINRFFIKVNKRNLGLTVNTYTSQNGKWVIVNDKVFKKRGKFLGVSIGLSNSLNYRKFKIDVGGGIFFPGSTFADRSAKYRLKFKVGRKW